METTIGDLLRRAMRGTAQSVFIISTRDAQGRRHAMAATAVTSVSMEPPTMLFCINRGGSMFPAIESGTDFAINLLTADHTPLAQLCSNRASGEARFTEYGWLSEGDTPYLSGAQASIICSQLSRQDVGTHAIVVGAVRSIIMSQTADPLVYLAGQYLRLPGAVGADLRPV